MLQLFMDKQFLPIFSTVLAVFVILITRPSFLVRSSTNVSCPLCLNEWLVSLIALLVGAGTYLFINKEKIPQFNLS